MTVLYANPYDITAAGFYFESPEDYSRRAAKCRNSGGDPVEEYAIEFIDGDEIDAEMFEALKIHQGNFGSFLEACDMWDEDQKRRVILAVRDCGYNFDISSGDPDDFEVDIYEADCLSELGRQFVDDGLYGEIPESIKNYLDYDAIARDLGFDYIETTIAGRSIVYRCL